MKRFLIAALALAATAVTASAQSCPTCPRGGCPATPVRNSVRFVLSPIQVGVYPQQMPTYTAMPPPVTTVQKSTVTTTQATVAVQQNYAVAPAAEEDVGAIAKIVENMKARREARRERRHHLLGGRGCGM